MNKKGQGAFGIVALIIGIIIAAIGYSYDSSFFLILGLAWAGASVIGIIGMKMADNANSKTFNNSDGRNRTSYS